MLREDRIVAKASVAVLCGKVKTLEGGKYVLITCIFEIEVGVKKMPM